MNTPLQSLIRRFRRDERGVAGLIAAASIMAAATAAALAVDMSVLYSAKISLQASTDASALAGARNILTGDAVATATTYSSLAGKKNVSDKFTATMVSGYPQLKCFTSIGITCGGAGNANGLVVKQQADVPLFFAKIFGITTSRITTTATAAASGGAAKPLDLMIVFDATASMNDNDPNCPVANSTRGDCALLGARSLMKGLWPCQPSSSGCGTVTNGNVANPLNRVGLMLFPGVTTAAEAAKDYDCSSSTKPTNAKYNASPVYQIIPLSSDYRVSTTATSLNTASNLVRAARGGASGCTAGLTNVGGMGSYFAGAINAAQSALAASGRPGAQKVIVLLSDGDMGATSTNVGSALVNNQCKQGVTAAQTAKAAGTWVYSVAYGASTSSTSSCATDTPKISACATMQQIASDPSKFFSSGGGCTSGVNSVSNLITIFQNIGATLSLTRLLPDNVT